MIRKILFPPIWSLILVLLGFAPLKAVAALDMLQIDQTASTTTLSIRDSQEVKLRFRYNCSSTTQNASNAVITDAINANLEIVSLTGSIHTTSATYDSATRKVTFKFVNPLPAGSSGDVFIQARFLSSTAENTIAKNSAVFSASNANSKTSNEVSIKGINANTTPTYPFTKGLSITKSAENSWVNANEGRTRWFIRHGNTGSTGQNAANYTIEDILPTGTMLDSFSTENFPNTSAPVSVFYKTNQNGTYRQWGSGAKYNTGSGGQTFWPGELGLKANEYVTALKWSYGTLAGGGKFHPNAMAWPISLVTRIIDPNATAFSAGKTVKNCATVTATGETSKSSCATVTVSTPGASFGFWHYVSNPSAPYKAGSNITYTIAFGINAESNTAVSNPSLGVLMPKELSYVGSPAIYGDAFTAAGSPAPKFTQTPNWKGTGRTLVRWSWSAGTGNALNIPKQRDWKYLYINFNANIAAATKDGWYRSTAYGNWTPNGQGGSWFEKDTEDWDANGNSTEWRARHDTDLEIQGLAPRYAFDHWINNNSSPYEMNENISYTTRMQILGDSAVPLKDPVIAVLLPKEIEYVGNPVISGSAYNNAGKPAPVFQKVANFGGTGQTLVRWLWTTATGNSLTIPTDGSKKSIQVTFDAHIKNFTPNGSYKTQAYGNWVPNGLGFWWMETDATDFDGNGNITEQRALAETWTSVLTAGGSAGFNSQMLVKGELDSDWTAFPSQGLTTPGGKADYKVTLSNPSGVIMRNLVLIDILPVVGDRGVVDLTARGSQWSPYLAAPVTASGATVSYSLSSNPCRNELTPGIPVGCESPNWTVTPPADITKVRSVKIDFGTTKIYPGDNLVVQWPMRAPVNAPTNGQVAWNSFGYIAARNDDGTSLLASEPIKTGISIKAPEPPFYGDFVWNDVNKNGVQDSGEPGVNGVRVELYKDNGDNQNNPLNDTLIGFTTTGNDGSRDGAYLFTKMGAGNFYAVVIPPADWGFSPSNQGGNDAKDSDGEAIIFRGARAAVMPITTLDTLEDDRTWDVGISDRSGQPSVWAMVTMSDGRVLLGGRFQTSHGLPRKGIVRVNKDGSVDPTFNPGSGFNGDVKSLSLRPDGKILAGGTFTTYNGVAANGVALINTNGTSAGAMIQPDANNVRWVEATSNGMFIGGSFNNVGGAPCRNIAKYKLDGTVDGSFKIGQGADGNVNSGAVQADGKIVIAGNFTSYAGVARNRIARINPDGSLDPTFDPGAGASGEVFSVKMIEDGRIILTGSFNSCGGQKCNGTMRLLTDGKPDPTLNPSALTVDSIQTTN